MKMDPVMLLGYSIPAAILLQDIAFSLCNEFVLFIFCGCAAYKDFGKQRRR